MVKAKVAAKAKPNPKSKAKTSKEDKGKTRTKAQAKADNPGKAKTNNAIVAMQKANEEQGRLDDTEEDKEARRGQGVGRG